MTRGDRGTQAHGPYVALLRGINVGGKNVLPMKDLAALFADAGCAGVKTYIQSGNVVFRAGPSLARRVPKVIADAISARFGIDAAVVTRTAEELRAIAEANPFLRDGADVATLHVAFLADAPEAARVAALDPDRSPPDVFVVLGREIYLRCPNGFGPSKLTNAWFDSKLATTSTVRNWRTVLKLVDLTRGD
jgi:uncharacterized protein (DUF1697 family)